MVKYAVPVSGGQVCAHFGHCEAFALIEVDEEKKTILSSTTAPSPGHEPGFLPGWLAQMGVNKVIAGGMGSRAQDLFRQNNVQVITGAMENDPVKAVSSYINGNLETGDNSCDH